MCEFPIVNIFNSKYHIMTKDYFLCDVHQIKKAAAAKMPDHGSPPSTQFYFILKVLQHLLILDVVFQ